MRAALSHILGWLIDPLRGPIADGDDVRSRLYSGFILVIAATGLSLGLLVFPMAQGASDVSQNATFRAGALAALGFLVSYGLARRVHLDAASRLVVGTALVCAYLAALEEPRILVFTSSAVMIASASLPTREIAVVAIASAMGPILMSWQRPEHSLDDLIYPFGANVMFSTLLMLAGWYRSSLAERAAKEEARVADLLEQAPDGVLLCNDRGRILSSNAAMAHLTGRSQQALLTARLQDLGIHQVHARASGESFDATLAGRRVEVTVWRREGRQVHLLVRDREAREQALEKRRTLLAELEEARRLESLGRLAGGVAHDLNNQLTVILGTAELLGANPQPDDARSILEAGDHARRLVAQLLTFAQGHPGSGTTTIDDVLLGLRPILTSMAREDVALQLEASAADVCVPLDQTQLEQVLINLLGNAIDASRAGDTVAVRTERTSEEPASVRLTVEDEGDGIDDAVQPHLFEPFFTTKETGTGLGLATVRGLLQRVGGSIRAERNVPRGSRFVVTLPIVAAARPPNPTPLSTPARLPVDTRALVVDDQPAVGNIVRRILEAHGVRVRYERDPRIADQLLEEPGSFELLVTDVVMPHLSGVELARRAIAHAPSLAVVLTTAYPREEDMADSIVVFKPFTSEALLREVSRALAEKTSA